NRFVNLMIRYDGSVMTYAANMWDYAYPGGAALYYMERQVPVGRRFQPMTTRFSQIVPELGWCADPENPHPATACTVTQDMDLYVDWFLYTPATNISIWDAESYAWWMDVNGLNNVNTTGLQLAAPTTVDTQEVVLQSPATAPTGGVREWIVFPPTHSIELNAGVMYHVEWSTRRKLTSNGAFSNWSPWEDGGFTYEPSPWDVYLREVRVRVSYWYTFQGTEVMEDCMGLVNGITETSCEGESGIERGTGADTDVPLVFGLAQNEPNPAGGPTHIAFTLPDATTARLTVYDVTGREVAVLVDGEMASGHHEVVLDTDALPAGVYAYVLRTPTDHAVRRLTIR
ncbi:MAG TPA: T9SS type A sorting domain-containing protein, partial [Rhodothermales bacterium]|nr:T9SS type A sorting domain-containing protein [Rhodothermales bacterium]